MKEIFLKTAYILLLAFFLYLAGIFFSLGINSRGSLAALIHFFIFLVFLGIFTVLAVPPFTDWIARKFAHSLYFPDLGKVEDKLYSLPRSLVKRGEFESAVKAYEEILANDQEDRTARWELADILAGKLKKLSQAREHYFRLYATSSEEKEKLFLLTRILDLFLEENKKEEALKFLKDELPQWKNKEGENWIRERIEMLQD